MMTPPTLIAIVELDIFLQTACDVPAPTARSFYLNFMVRSVRSDP